MPEWRGGNEGLEKSRTKKIAMVKFEYLEPKSLKEACKLLEQHPDDGKLIAGGTALLIMMRMRLLNPGYIISLEKIPDFNYIRHDDKEGLRIGAGARHREIELSPAVRTHYPLIHETFRKVAQPRIRNMGTIGGNLCQGDFAKGLMDQGIVGSH